MVQFAGTHKKKGLFRVFPEFSRFCVTDNDLVEKNHTKVATSEGEFQARISVNSCECFLPFFLKFRCQNRIAKSYIFRDTCLTLKDVLRFCRTLLITRLYNKAHMLVWPAPW